MTKRPTLLRLAVATSVLLGAIGCTSRPPQPPNLSGSYQFSRSNYDGDMPVGYMPLLPLRDLQDESIVDVKVGTESIVLDYIDSRGAARVSVTLLSDSSVSWDEESIAVSQRPGGVPIFPGLSYERVSMECRRNSGGNLVLEWKYREYGLMLFILPFVDWYGGHAELELVE